MSRIKRQKSLAEQIAELENPTPKDLDPEALDDHNPNDDDDLSGTGSDGEFNGREHYVDVGKSKLRKRDAIPLGPQYVGSRISRDAALEEESDDPFEGRFDEEEDSEQDYPVNGVDDKDSDEESEKHENGMENEFSDEDDSEGFDEDEDEDDENSGSDNEDEESEDAVDHDKIRELMSEQQKTVAATLSEAAKADVEKGRAVKSQRAAFDSLLNTRIRLQKALIAANSLSSSSEEDEVMADDGENALEAAETAALNLLNTLSSLRSALQEARTGTKRKRVVYERDSPSQAIWTNIQEAEKDSISQRNATLDKWSAKTRPTAVISQSRRLNNAPTAEQTLTDVLKTQISDTTRLVKRTRVPRSCAPVQAAAGVTESAGIYDDADFYGLLLKELLEQRSHDVSFSINGGSSFQAQTSWQAVRDAKIKKVVDTRASKGRKLRYTVHEKLQSFMASEDRGTWGEKQVDELFGSLFGRKMGLGEEEKEDVSEDEQQDDVQEQGLLLFRS